MWRILCTVPLICYDSWKRVSIEVKQMSSYCQTRMRCACVSELACMHVVIAFETGKQSFRAFSYKASGGLIHACINLSCSEKWCFPGSQTRMHNRVEWFLKKILSTCHVVVDCSGTSNPTFYFDLLPFHLAHGKKRAKKSPKIPKKGLKSAPINFIWRF